MITETREAAKRSPRDAAIVVRLSTAEKDRLEEYALRKDLRVGQAARHFINQQLATLDDGA